MWKYDMIAGYGVWLAPFFPPIPPTTSRVLEQEVREEQWRPWACSSRRRDGNAEPGWRHHPGGTLLGHQGNLCSEDLPLERGKTRQGKVLCAPSHPGLSLVLGRSLDLTRPKPIPPTPGMESWIVAGFHSLK